MVKFSIKIIFSNRPADGNGTPNMNKQIPCQFLPTKAYIQRMYIVFFVFQCICVSLEPIERKKYPHKERQVSMRPQSICS